MKLFLFEEEGFIDLVLTVSLNKDVANETQVLQKMYLRNILSKDPKLHPFDKEKERERESKNLGNIIQSMNIY